MEAKSTTEKTSPIKEKTKKFMMKGMTESLPELLDLPVEVLVKIFNFLPNRDIRCGISLACKINYDVLRSLSSSAIEESSESSSGIFGTLPTSVSLKRLSSFRKERNLTLKRPYKRFKPNLV